MGRRLRWASVLNIGARQADTNMTWCDPAVPWVRAWRQIRRELRLRPQKYLSEVRIPLASTLDSTLGVRVSDFSSFGSHTTAHAGLRWQPADAWTLRADFAQLFRAPSLAELYEREVERDGNVTFDPCGTRSDSRATRELRGEWRSGRQLCSEQ